MRIAPLQVGVINRRLGDHWRCQAQTMRFSLRTLMIVVVLVSLPFGAVTIYSSVWHSHCRKMEASLFRFIVNDELTPPANLEAFEFVREGELFHAETRSSERIEPRLIYLGVSRPGSDVLVPPSSALIESIGIPEIRQFRETVDGEFLFYIKILKWIDWETVEVDYGSHGALSGGGADGVKLKFTDGEWTIIETGSYWVS